MDDEKQMDRVQKIPIAKLVPFRDHPFKVVEDESMLRTTESISMFGVLTPLIARPAEDGKYEIISGHRRAHAAEAVGLAEVPVIVRDMDDDVARILVVDSNLQRENILPSERAFAYKMKADAMKHQGERTDLQQEGTLDQVGPKWTSQEIGRATNDSMSQVKRFIRLTNLIPELLEMLDQKRISFNPAVELSYLKPEEQKNLIEAMDFTQAAPSLSQAMRLKKLSQEGGCPLDDMCEILGEVKKGDLERVAFKTEQIRKFFPKSYVRCLIDEAANIGQIPNLEKLVATIRSREISACLVLQARSQLKAIYKDNADTIIGNMDSQVFLGGSEPTTLKELAEALGKETIDTFNTSDTRGNSPSYGMNYQKLGKELMSRDELAVMNGSKCVLQLRGVRPFLSDKYDITQHPNYKYTSDYDKKYTFDIEKYLNRRMKLKADDEYDVIEA